MKTTLYMATSVDGYIAGLNDQTPWSDSSWDKYREVVDAAGCLIIGRKTYEIMRNDGDFSSFANLKCLIIISSNEVKGGQTKIVSGPIEALALANAEGYDRAVVGGGAQLNSSFLSEGFIDEVYLDIEPILLGDGISFSKVAKQTELTYREHEELGEGVIHIEYEVVK